MKLLYAGHGVSVKSYTELLFNCVRNQKCERLFYVPVNFFSDIVLYADLPGKPTLMQIEVMNVCDIANVGTAVSSKYVIGQTNTDAWYATIGQIVVTPPVGVTYNKFFFKLSFTVSGVVHVYYSQQYEFPYCDDLKFLRGCYPNEEVGTDAYDCNGLYYGFPTNEDFLGDQYYRYIHTAFLRMSSVIEQRNKFTFTAFNSKKIYKSVFNREWLLEFEIVPTFYKDALIGIFARGQVQYDGTEYILAESQDISIIDVDSKLWKMDMLFASECKNTFGCSPADCILPGPPPPVCCDPVITAVEVETIEPPTCCDPAIVSAVVETVEGFDVDAQAFIDAVGTLDSDTQIAINDLVIGLKDASIWTKFYAIYPYAGSTAAEHKWNLKNPVDSDAAYRLTFVSMGHSAQGLVPTNSSADTKFMTFPSINSEHISAYILTNNTTVGCELGNTDSSANNGTGFYARATSNNTYWNTDVSAKVFNPTTDARGLWIVSRTGSTAAELNKNGSTVQTSSASAAAGPGVTIKIATDAGGVNNTDKITAWNSIGSGLTTAECAALYTVVQAYQTALGRSV